MESISIRQLMVADFDINTDFVWDVVQNDLQPLLEAIEYFIKNIYDIVPFEKE